MGKLFLKPPVAYLVRSDFTDDGKLKPGLTSEPVFVMIQASYCPHCDDAIPIFQRLANTGMVKAMTVQIDGTSPGEVQLKGIMDKIFQDKFIPAFVLMMPDGRKIAYSGPRNYDDMSKFLRDNVRR